ncbi:MAG: hypothetical protein R2850_07795 [Bacteroidia bacterium]
MHEATLVARKDDGFIILQLSMSDVLPPEQMGDDVVLNTGSPHYVSFVQDTSNLDINRE